MCQNFGGEGAISCVLSTDKRDCSWVSAESASTKSDLVFHLNKYYSVGLHD